MIGYGAYGNYIYALGKPFKVIDSKKVIIKFGFKAKHYKTLEVFRKTLFGLKRGKFTFKNVFYKTVQRVITNITKSSRATNSSNAVPRDEDLFE